MALFIIRESGQPDRRFKLKGRQITIGREEGTMLVLPNTTVSRQHATINRPEKNKAVIAAASEECTILHNGTRITETSLSTGDSLQIGRYTLVFFGDTLSPIEQFFEGKGLDEFPVYARTANATKADGTFQLSAADAQRMLRTGNITRSARVVRVSDSQTWTPSNGTLTFGKQQDIAVSGWFVMGKVCEIRWDGAAHVIESFGFPSRVRVGDASISEARSLSDGDSFSVGGDEYRYMLR